jgi:hypothetical protein
MPRLDAFKVIEVFQGSLKATSIYVRGPGYPIGTTYPTDLDEDTVLTLRLTPSADAVKENEEDIEKGGLKILLVDPEEVERVPDSSVPHPETP